MLSHNRTMAVSPGIPLAGKHRLQVPKMRQSRDSWCLDKAVLPHGQGYLGMVLDKLCAQCARTGRARHPTRPHYWSLWFLVISCAVCALHPIEETFFLPLLFQYAYMLIVF